MYPFVVFNILPVNLLHSSNFYIGRYVGIMFYVWQNTEDYNHESLILQLLLVFFLLYNGTCSVFLDCQK